MNNNFTVPILSSSNPVLIEPEDVTMDPVEINSNLQKNTLKDLNTVWDQKRFSTARLPVVTGEVEEKELFSNRSNLRVLDLPIKFPYSNYRIPQECRWFASLIRQIIACELSVNSATDSLYAYLTIDQNDVKVGQTQRNPGLHVDGFQGARIQPKIAIDHSYVVSDQLPTVFYAHGFETAHLDERRNNFFLDFDRQANENETWKPNPYEICLMSAYQVHRSDLAKKDTPRTFFRLSYTLRQFDRLGNTHNPLFNYSWEMVPRDTHSALK